MSDYRDFDNLKSLTRIEGILLNETPLRIGVGGEAPLESPVDLAVYRVNNTPCIPGSSLKGVFRSFIEALATSKKLPVHSPWQSDIMKNEAKNNDFCVVCGIFGSTEIASHLKVYDAYPLNKEKAPTFLKTGVGISREFGAVSSGPFTEELVIPSVEWGFKMDVINIKLSSKPENSDERGSLLNALLEALSDVGLSVGARKTVGCGLLKLKEARWSVFSLQSGGFKLIEEGRLR